MPPLWLTFLLSTACAVNAFADCESQWRAELARSVLPGSAGLARLSIVDEGRTVAFPTAKSGRWIERREQSDGKFELHRVDGRTRERIFWDERCRPQRRSAAEGRSWLTATPGDFTDVDWDRLRATQPRGLIYVWSPKMPLSISGLPEIRAAALELGLPLAEVLDPGLSSKEVAEARARIPGVRVGRSFDLDYRGAFLHFPSVLVHEQGSVRGAPILGRLGREGWKSAIAHRLQESDASLPFAESWVPRTGTRALIRIRKVSRLPRRFGYFDKPVWGTRWLGVHIDWGESSFYNLDTGALVPLGYTNDTYVTPGDHLYTTFWATPGMEGGGVLGWMETAGFLKKADDPAFSPPPLLLDATINADYQSVGTLRRETGASQYRVITGGFRNTLSFRDYRIQHRTANSAPQVEPLGGTGLLCRQSLGGGEFATPMLSKDGQELGVTSIESPPTSRVMRIDAANPERCAVAVAFPSLTSKLAFSFDRRSIAFRADGAAWLFRRDSSQLLRLDGFAAALGPGQPQFPEFREDGSLLAPYLEDSGAMDIIEFTVP